MRRVRIDDVLRTFSLAKRGGKWGVGGSSPSRTRSERGTSRSTPSTRTRRPSCLQTRGIVPRGGATYYRSNSTPRGGDRGGRSCCCARRVGRDRRARTPSSMRPILRPARASARSADWAPGPGVFVLLPVRKSNVRVSKPKTPRARTPSTLVRGRQALSRCVEAARIVNNTSRPA